MKKLIWNPIGNRVIILLDNQEKEHRQKVSVEEEDFKATGKIIAIGTEVQSPLNNGNKVIIDKYAGVYLYENDTIYKIVNVEDIFAYAE